jgi:hypothetical protein
MHECIFPHIIQLCTYVQKNGIIYKICRFPMNIFSNTTIYKTFKLINQYNQSVNIFFCFIHWYDSLQGDQNKQEYFIYTNCLRKGGNLCYFVQKREILQTLKLYFKNHVFFLRILFHFFRDDINQNTFKFYTLTISVTVNKQWNTAYQFIFLLTEKWFIIIQRRNC